MSHPKRIAILGAGESGVGAALLGRRLGYDVCVSDQSPIKPNFRAELEQNGIAYEETQHSLDEILTADLVVKSPGIPESAMIMQSIREKGLPVIGEIEFAWQHAGRCTVVAITGTNGKTTTTELTYHLLKTAGLPVRMGGNVGYSFARHVADDVAAGRTADRTRTFVLEVSSFQLDDTEQFRPDIAVLLNITPDHLDRYDHKLEYYVGSKFRITRNQRTGDVFLYNAFDPVIRDRLERRPLNELVTNIGIRKGFDQGRMLQVDFEHGYDMTGSHLLGPHNRFNATCAARVALLCGATDEQIQEGLASFRPPAHRMEKIAEINGVTYINDSKATNVDSVYYALQAMEDPTIWIVGGQDKGNDYAPLLPLVGKKVKAIVCLGADNTKLIDVFSRTRKPLVETHSAETAVEMAARLAEPGDTVLLSPACASFDLFKNYEHRGEMFRAAVLNLKTHPT